MLSVIIVSHHRPEALRTTLRELLSQEPVTRGEIIVADNASLDGTVEMLNREFPGVRVVVLDENLGVEAFNRGAAIARGDILLILDDDARPDPAALREALAVLDREPGVAAVALHPRHPATKQSEWPFAKAARDHWPVMGCGNLVRAEAWLRVGGYESAFFLYRNDVDLALKLLAAGYDVRFDPAWVVWHDSPAAARKSERWLRLATRNWVWLAKRHGRGVGRWIGGVAGVVRALRHAGISAPRIGCVLSGTWNGMTKRAPSMAAADTRGVWYRDLLRLRVGPTPPDASAGRARHRGSSADS